jgi:hypothetical protein
LRQSRLSYRSFERFEADLATSPSVCFGSVSFGLALGTIHSEIGVVDYFLCIRAVVGD